MLSAETFADKPAQSFTDGDGAHRSILLWQGGQRSSSKERRYVLWGEAFGEKLDKGGKVF